MGLISRKRRLLLVDTPVDVVCALLWSKAVKVRRNDCGVEGGSSLLLKQSKPHLSLWQQGCQLGVVGRPQIPLYI